MRMPGPLSLRERVRVRAIGRENALPCLCDFPMPSPLPLSQRERGDRSACVPLNFVRMGLPVSTHPTS